MSPLVQWPLWGVDIAGCVCNCLNLQNSAATVLACIKVKLMTFHGQIKTCFCVFTCVHSTASSAVIISKAPVSLGPPIATVPVCSCNT